MTYIPKTQSRSAAKGHSSAPTLDSSTLTLSSDISHPRHHGHNHARQHSSHRQLTHLPVHSSPHPSTGVEQPSF
ncbi:MAG TPA: hypothetical protein VFA09_07880 [Ktedonobacteraceae bacterium]|nr:hypothetical protein [Ktedonobacteraceae bacterium]